MTIAIDISLTDHLVDLLVGLSKGGFDATHLGGGDETVFIVIDELEEAAELLGLVGVLHLAGHVAKELVVVNFAVAVGIELLDLLLELILCGVLTHGA